MPDALQRLAAVALALATAPLQAALGLLIKADTPGPALYRAVRVGRDGAPFVCFKLRTMRVPASPETSSATADDASGDDALREDAPAVSREHDARVTRVGRLLRRVRLDELPQLWNVARGEMRFVGPRPEDPRFVDPADPLHREVFTATPGITGITQLVYAGEGRLLDAAADPERVYREEILPAKVRLDAAYLRHRSPSLDVWVVSRTPLALFGRPIRLPAAVAAEVASLERGAPAAAGPAAAVSPDAETAAPPASTPPPPTSSSDPNSPRQPSEPAHA